MTRFIPEWWESPLCIGHSAPSAQHAMRASGVGAHPAQTAAWPANKIRLSPTVERRRASITTFRRMLDRGGVVKRRYAVSISFTWLSPSSSMEISRILNF